MVTVLDPDALTEAALNVAVTPAGNVESFSATVPLKPPDGVERTVNVALPPAVIDCDAGVMLSVKLGEVDTPPGTVQAPRCTQLAVCDPSVTVMYTFLLPANAGRKLSASRSVNVFPEAVTDEIPEFKLHWLLDEVPATPTVNGLWNVPASSAR